MNLFFFSKNFIKQVSLVGVAAWIGYPQIVNAEGMVVESGTMERSNRVWRRKVSYMMQQVFPLLVRQW